MREDEKENEVAKPFLRIQSIFTMSNMGKDKTFNSYDFAALQKLLKAFEYQKALI